MDLRAKRASFSLYRLLSYTPLAESAEVRRALRDTAFQRPRFLIVGAVATLGIASLAYAVTHQTWPITWIVLDLLLVAVRVRLIMTAVSNPHRRRGRDHAYLMLFGWLWCVVFGTAAFLCVGTGDRALQILVATNLSGTLSAAASRNASTPRYGALVFLTMALPFVLAVELLPDAHMGFVAFLVAALSVGAYLLLLQNHRIVIRLFDAESKASALARTDPVTGLHNRTYLKERLASLCDGALRARVVDQFSVLCLDLDKFKAVNDTYGHHTGDVLLVAVADRLRAATRDVDIVCRVGGDEFVIILTGTTEQGAAMVAERIVQSLKSPFDIDVAHAVVIGVSIGGVTSSGRHDDPSALLDRADKALYGAKHAGRGRYVHVGPEEVGP